MEYIIEKMLDGWRGDVLIDGHKISILWYVDHILLLVNMKLKLQHFRSNLKNISQVYGLSISAEKIKVIMMDRSIIFGIVKKS